MCIYLFIYVHFFVYLHMYIYIKLHIFRNTYTPECSLESST